MKHLIKSQNSHGLSRPDSTGLVDMSEIQVNFDSNTSFEYDHANPYIVKFTFVDANGKSEDVIKDLSHFGQTYQYVLDKIIPLYTTGKKTYVSGKITGLQYEEALKSFNDGSNAVRKYGLHAVNPMEIEHNHDNSWENFMRVDLKALLDCDVIYMMKGWKDSRGAKIEHQLAQDLKLMIIYQNEQE